MNPQTDPDIEATLRRAVRRASTRYFTQCRRRIPAFVGRHFRYPGAWRTNRVAFGWDLLKMPFNLLWAPFYVLAQLMAWLLRHNRATRSASYLRSLPSGFETRVQATVRTLIVRDLLRNDCKNTSLTALVQQEIHRTVEKALPLAQTTQLDVINQAADALVADALKQYGTTRTASADIANSIISTAVGAITLKQFTPGGLGFGIIIAALWAKHSAAADFVLGETLGRVYYGLFPPEPSWLLIFFSTLAVMCLLAVIAAFSGLITDPIQSHLRIHHRRLRKMLAYLEADLQQNRVGGFRPKDQYLARIVELIDACKTHMP